MKDLFKNILNINEVQGVMFLSFDGKVIFKKFKSTSPEKIEDKDWPFFVHTLNHIRAAELVYKNSIIYIRKTKTGYIFVIMSRFAPVAMIRLNCDILLPHFEQTEQKPKGFRRFFMKPRRNQAYEQRPGK